MSLGQMSMCQMSDQMSLGQMSGQMTGHMSGQMSVGKCLAKCLSDKCLAKCLSAKCSLAKCLSVKCMFAKCLLATCLSAKWHSTKTCEIFDLGQIKPYLHLYQSLTIITVDGLFTKIILDKLFFLSSSR